MLIKKKVKKAVFPVAGLGTVEGVPLKGRRFDCGSIEGHMAASFYEYNKRSSK